MKKGIIILVVILVVLALVAVYIVAQAGKGDESTDGAEQSIMSGAESNEELTEETVDVNVNPNADKKVVTLDGKTYAQKENMVNILLLGIDSDAERVKNKQGWRSDMIMLCSIDKDTNEVTFTSIPRDTRADVYHVGADGKITGTVTEKLNHAYSYGGGPTKYSAENAMRCTSEFLACGGLINVPIDYYISIDLDGLPKLAAEMGGVEVTLDQSVPDVGGKGDTVSLEGDTVRKFLENRHDMSEGEMTRQLHEQMFIKSLAGEIKDMGAKEAAPELYNTFMKFMRTNMKVDEVLDLAGTLDSVSADNMKFNLMEKGAGEMIGTPAVWSYRASQDEVVRMMLDALYNEQ